MSGKAVSASADPHRWVVFSTICLVYFFVYFHRVSTSVIASDLLRTFNTDATALGFMSSMYFYLYAFEQPLVGYLTDRIGPRRVIGYWSLVAAAGCFLFGIAPNIGWASAGRALIGIGVGGVYVPAIKAFSLWFRKKEFSTMIGLLMSVGNLGAVIATTPLAWTAALWGWRPTFFAIGGITLGLAFGTLLLTKDHGSSSHEIQAKQGGNPPGESNTKSNVLMVISSGQFWILGSIFFGIYGTLITLQGLWATPFLMAVMDIESIVASKLNMLIPIGVIIGAPLLGWLPARFHLDLKKVLIAIVGIYSLTWFCIIFLSSQLGTLGLAAIFLMMGIIGGGFISTLWGIIRESAPSKILGLASGMLNPAPFLGIAVFQVLTGAILDRSTGRVGDLYPVSAFDNAFMVCFLGTIVCLVLTFFIRKADGGS